MQLIKLPLNENCKPTSYMIILCTGTYYVRVNIKQFSVSPFKTNTQEYLSKLHSLTDPSTAQEASAQAIPSSSPALGWKTIAQTLQLWPRRTFFSSQSGIDHILHKPLLQQKWNASEIAYSLAYQTRRLTSSREKNWAAESHRRKPCGVQTYDHTLRPLCPLPTALTKKMWPTWMSLGWRSSKI